MQEGLEDREETGAKEGLIENFEEAWIVMVGLTLCLDLLSSSSYRRLML